MWYSCKYKCVCFTLISTECYINFDRSRLKTCLRFWSQLRSLFVNLNLSRISAEAKISDLRPFVNLAPDPSEFFMLV